MTLKTFDLRTRLGLLLLILLATLAYLYFLPGNIFSFIGKTPTPQCTTTSAGQTICLPSFLIIGAEKCGTTALFNYIMRHPYVFPPSTTQSTFFFTCSDDNCPIQKYQEHFVVPGGLLQNDGNLISGDLAPQYLANRPDGQLPKEIKAHLPNVKLLVVLCDPVDRTLDLFQEHFKRATIHYNVTDTRPQLSLPTIVAQHEGDLLQCYERAEALNTPVENCHSNSGSFNLLSAGIYVDQLKSWFKHFPRNQFLFVDGSELDEDPNGVLGDVFSFLELAKFKVEKVNLRLPFPDVSKKDLILKRNEEITSKRSNKGWKGRTLPKSVRQFLCEFFEPQNTRLFELIGFRFTSSC